MTDKDMIRNLEEKIRRIQQESKQAIEIVKRLEELRPQFDLLDKMQCAEPKNPECWLCAVKKTDVWKILQSILKGETS